VGVEVVRPGGKPLDRIDGRALRGHGRIVDEGAVAGDDDPVGAREVRILRVVGDEHGFHADLVGQ